MAVTSFDLVCPGVASLGVSTFNFPFASRDLLFVGFGATVAFDLGGRASLPFGVARDDLLGVDPEGKRFFAVLPPGVGFGCCCDITLLVTGVSDAIDGMVIFILIFDKKDDCACCCCGFSGGRCGGRCTFLTGCCCCCKGL